jgi:hypothetical protein
MKYLLLLLVLTTGCAGVQIPPDALDRVAIVRECVAIVSDCISEAKNAEDGQDKVTALNACFKTIVNSECIEVAAEIVNEGNQNER